MSILIPLVAVSEPRVVDLATGQLHKTPASQSEALSKLNEYCVGLQGLMETLRANVDELSDIIVSSGINKAS